ncbi:hypothetical protein MUDAN_DOGOELCO_03227 [Lactiplantibacillus mudanjiangensis]|nr:hypothetical protein MUDAN_DOGOELCO_03227 [Lactiplantibacillus mudanjiangensis]
MPLKYDPTKVLAKMKVADPDLVSDYDDDYLNDVIELAADAVANSGIDVKRDTLVTMLTAYRALALLVAQDDDFGISDMKAKDLEITMTNGNANRWEDLYETLLNDQGISNGWGIQIG